MSDYATARESLEGMRQNALEAFGVGRQFLALCREAGLPEPKVCGDGPGQGWTMRFGRTGGHIVAWVGFSGGIDLRALEGYGTVVFARDQTAEQAVEWLKERVK